MTKLTKTTALKEAVRRWGNTAAVQDRGIARASTPERRGEALEKYRARLTLTHEERRTRRKEFDALFSEAMRYRYSVGHLTHGIAFHVEGQGDTWEAAFAEADTKSARFQNVAA